MELADFVGLDEFISATIKDVISGVQSTQKHAREHGAAVVPADASPYRDIEFNIALTATKRDQAEGGIAVLLAPFSGGFKGKEETESATISRIRFTVPVRLPAMV